MFDPKNKFNYIQNTMKNKMLTALHENAQRFIARSHAADRRGEQIRTFINFHLYNLCYNLRDILRK